MSGGSLPNCHVGCNSCACVTMSEKTQYTQHGGQSRNVLVGEMRMEYGVQGLMDESGAVV